MKAPMTPPNKYNFPLTSNTENKASRPVKNHKLMLAAKADICTQLVAAHILDDSIRRVLKTPCTLINKPASSANTIPIEIPPVFNYRYLIVSQIKLF